MTHSKFDLKCNYIRVTSSIVGEFCVNFIADVILHVKENFNLSSVDLAYKNDFGLVSQHRFQPQQAKSKNCIAGLIAGHESHTITSHQKLKDCRFL